ncbi:MAG: hypothetical protein R3266_00830 [Gemmatimonadota bacterium]|nr:hypothetical protein [Gemmatimonadota bacterium]
MQRKRWMTTAMAALFAGTMACSDEDGLGPSGDVTLSPQEAGDVAELAADAVDGILDGELAANPLVAPAVEGDGGELSFSAAPVTTTFQFERERACRDGGLIVAQGEGTHVADRATGEVTLDIAGTKTITDCARARGDLVVTINGQGTFAGHRHKVNGEFVGLQTHEAAGSFTWETSDGRSGSCEYEINVTWDPATHTKTVTGFVCDREIDRTVTRDGRPGNDRGDSA